MSLELYADLLARDADLLGLTAKRGSDQIRADLIEDSLTGARWLPEKALVLDLGSGGGCPGIPLQLVRPDCVFTLLEANQRKAGFLARACQALNLQQVVVLSERSEDLAQRATHRGRYDCVVAKAVAPLNVLVELALPFLKLHGKLIAYKGKAIHEELPAAEKALRELRGKLLALEPYEWGDRTYYHCLIEKVGETPKSYPRRPGIPASKPLL